MTQSSPAVPPTMTDILHTVQQWPVASVSVAVVDLFSDAFTAVGDVDRPYALASVTKLLTAYAALLAVEEGALDLDGPLPAPVAEAPSVTLSHLLSHASGLAAEGEAVVAPVATRRIYSNGGYEAVARQVALAVDMDFARYLESGVLQPLGMSGTSLVGSAAHGATSTVGDLVTFVRELAAPALLHPTSVGAMTSVAYPGLVGVLPGFGRQDPNDWGLGPEIHAAKSPHWLAPAHSPATFGHFGRSGTFVWVDPVARLACVCLTDEPFGDWAVRCWPALNAAILDGSRSRR